MRYLTNGFSISMFRDPNMKPVLYSLSEEEFIKLINHGDFKSVIGHEDLSKLLTKLTGKKIPYNRRGIMLNYDDEMIVVYLTGRLPEHPTFVQYKGRLNFSYIRFEKQSQADMLQSLSRIEQITEIKEEVI